MDNRPDISLIKKGYENKGDGEKGLLLIHGIGGSPAELFLLADAFAKKGYGYKAITLPGHASNIEELDKVTFSQWMDTTEKALLELEKDYKKVYVLGLSMGGLIAVRISELHPEIKAAAFLAPALAYKSKSVPLAGALNLFMKHLKMNYQSSFPDGNEYYLSGGFNNLTSLHAVSEMNKLQRITKKELPGLKVPFVCFLTQKDTLVDPVGDYKQLSRVIDTDHEFVIYPASSHVLSIDINEKDVFAESFRFFEKH